MVRTIAVDVELVIGADVSASVAQLNEDLNQILSNSSLKTGIKLIDPANAGSLETIIGQLSEIVALTKQISQKPFMLSLGGATNRDVEYINLYKNQMMELLSVTQQMQEVALNFANNPAFTKALGQDAGAFYTLSQKLDLSSMSGKLLSANTTGEINKATQDLMAYHDVLERILNRVNANGIITPQIDTSGYEAAKEAVDGYSSKVAEGVEKTKQLLVGNQPGQQISSDLKIGSTEGGESFAKLGETIGETLSNIRTQIEQTFDLSTVDLHADAIREQISQLVSSVNQVRSYVANGATWDFADQSNQYGALQGVRNYFDVDGNQIRQVVTYYDELNHVTTALTTVRDAEGNFATTMAQTTNAMAQRAQEEHQEQENAKLAATADQQRVSALETVMTALQKYSGLQGENNAAVRESLSALSAAEAGLRNLELDHQNGTLTAEEYSRGVREITATITPHIGVLNRYSMAMRQQADAARQADAATKERAAAMRKAIAVEGQQATALRTTRQALNDFRSAQTSTKAGSKEAYQTLVKNETVLGRLQGMFKSGRINADRYGLAVKKVSERTKEATFTLKQNGEGIKTLGDRLKETAKRYSSYLLTSRLMFAAIRAVREMIKASIELDSAFTQLQIVTKVTDAEIEEFADTAAEAAKRVGSSITDLTSSATVFARLGYSLQESASLAEYTTMLQNVADIDVGDAQNAITAIVKAFSKEISIDNIESVMDKLVEVGNNFPISTAQIAEGMNNASSVLAAAGNTFEQSVALLTAANTTVQNASKAATGLRTVAARIRNTKTELDELGEDMTEAKYEEVVKALTDAHVALRDVNGDYRSTYEIMKDIAAQWDSLGSSRQAALATQLAGTRQQAIFYSIIEQFKEASGAMDAMADSAGALQTAYDTYLDSAQAKINQFKATFQELSTKVFDSDWIGQVVDAARVLIEALNGIFGILGKITNALGGLKVVLPVIIGLMAKAAFLRRVQAVSAALTGMQRLILVGTLGVKGAIAAIKNMGGSIAKAAAVMDAAKLKTMGFFTAIKNLGKGIAAWFVKGGWVTVVIVAITTIIALVSKLKNDAAEAAEKAKQEFEDAKSKLSEVSEQLKEAADRLADAKKRIAELEKLENPTFVDDAELDKLREEVDLLEREADLQEERKRGAQQDALKNFAKSAQKWLTTNSSKLFDEMGITPAWKGDVAKQAAQSFDRWEPYSHQVAGGDGFWDFMYSWVMPALGGPPGFIASEFTDAYRYAITPEQIIDDAESALTDLREAYKDALSGGNDDAIKTAKAQLETYENYLRTMLTDIQDLYAGIEWVSDPETEAEKESNKYYRILKNAEDQLLILLDETGDAKLNAINRILSMYGVESYEVFQSLKGTDEEVYQQIVEDLEAVGVSVDNVADAFDILSKKTSSGTVVEPIAEVEGLSESYTQLIKNLDLAATAEEEMAKNQTLSEGTMKSLADANKEYTDFLYEENGVVKLNTEAWREWAKAKFQAQIDAVKATGGTAQMKQFKEENAAIVDRIARLRELAELYNELGRGNVDYKNRPFIKASEVSKKWVDEELAQNPDNWVTVFTQGKNIGSGDHVFSIDITPILPNGEVLTPAELESYVNSLVTDSGIEGVLESDTQHLITNIAEGSWDAQSKYWADYENSLLAIKDEHTDIFTQLMGETGKSWEEINALVNQYDSLLNDDKNAQLLEVYIALFNEATKKANGFQNALDGLGSVKSGMDILDKLYLDVVDKDGFDFTSLLDSSFINTFSQYNEEFTKFLETITKSPDDIAACQSAFNDLATAYIRNSGALSGVSDATRDLTIATLKQMGVANAAEVVDNELAAQKEKLALQTGECADKNYEEVVSLYQEAAAGTTAKIELAQLAIEKFNNNNEKIDAQSDIDELIELATTARGTTEYIAALTEAKEKFARVEGLQKAAEMWSEQMYDEDGNINETAMKKYHNVVKQMEKYNQEVQDLVNTPPTFEPITIDFTGIVFEGGDDVRNYYDQQEKEAQKAAETAAEKADTWFDIQLAEHKHRVQMEQETEAQYLAWLDKAYKQAYAEGIHDLDEYRKYEEEVYDGRRQLAENAQSALDKLVDYRKKMLEQEVDDQKDALKEQLDALRDFYDKQKEMLQDSFDEEDYLRSQEEKRKSVTDIELKLAQIRGDDSAAAAKRRAELNQQLKEAKKELNDFERDHARDAATKLLDDEYAKQEEAINAEIDSLDTKYKSAKELYEEALRDIKNGSVSLYEEMIAWNAEYGDGIDDTITSAWEDAYKALQDYKTLYGSMFGGANLANATGYRYPSGGGYASGTSWAIPGLRGIDESGSETIFESSNGRKYKMFSGGEKVLNARASDFLYRFANGGSQLLEKFVKRVTGGVPEGIGARMQTNAIEMGDIIIQGNADKETVSQIRREQRKAVDFMLREINSLSY